MLIWLHQTVKSLFGSIRLVQKCWNRASVCPAFHWSLLYVEELKQTTLDKELMFRATTSSPSINTNRECAWHAGTFKTRDAKGVWREVARCHVIAWQTLRPQKCLPAGAVRLYISIILIFVYKFVFTLNHGRKATCSVASTWSTSCSAK